MMRAKPVLIFILILAAVFAPMSSAHATHEGTCIAFVMWVCAWWHWNSLDNFQICAYGDAFAEDLMAMGIAIQGTAYRTGEGLDAEATPLVDAPLTVGNSPLYLCTKTWNISGTSGIAMIEVYAATHLIASAHPSYVCLNWSAGDTWPTDC